MTPESRLRRWPQSDGSRGLIATVIATISTLIINRLWNAADDSITEIVVRSCIIAWGLLALVYSALLTIGFSGLPSAEFERVLKARIKRSKKGEPVEAWFGVQMSVLALLAMSLLAFAGDVRANIYLVVMGLGMVAASWAVVALSYTLHYAQLDLVHGGFSFPGEDPPSWIRYLYLAISVQATFGTTDVEFTTDRARRAILTQSIVAFLFNTVIVAVIVSMLLGTN